MKARIERIQSLVQLLKDSEEELEELLDKTTVTGLLDMELEASEQETLLLYENINKLADWLKYHNFCITSSRKLQVYAGLYDTVALAKNYIKERAELSAMSKEDLVKEEQRILQLRKDVESKNRYFLSKDIFRLYAGILRAILSGKTKKTEIGWISDYIYIDACRGSGLEFVLAVLKSKGYDLKVEFDGYVSDDEATASYDQSYNSYNVYMII